jgi:hypothetical protein
MLNRNNDEIRTDGHDDLKSCRDAIHKRKVHDLRFQPKWKASLCEGGRMVVARPAQQGVTVRVRDAGLRHRDQSRKWVWLHRMCNLPMGERSSKRFA